MPDLNSFPTADPLLGKLCRRLKEQPKRIVFTDGEDIRVIRSAARMVAMEIGVPILLGNKNRIEEMARAEDVNMTFVNVIEPAKSCELDSFCKRLAKTARYRNKDIANPGELVARPHNFAALMVQYGHADGMIAGNTSTPAVVFRAVISMIAPSPGVPKIFGTSVVSAPHLQHFGKDGVLFMADCGVIPKPGVKKLASIAVETGKLAQHLLGRAPRVAMLSHSSKGSAGTKQAGKIAAATQLARLQAREENLDIDIDGELQADVALDPAAAEVTLPDRRSRHQHGHLQWMRLPACPRLLRDGRVHG